MLAHLVSEPALSTAGPLDATLDFDPDDARDLAAALAYDAVPDCAERWIPARRRLPADCRSPDETAARPGCRIHPSPRPMCWAQRNGTPRRDGAREARPIVATPRAASSTTAPGERSHAGLHPLARRASLSSAPPGLDARRRRGVHPAIAAAAPTPIPLKEHRHDRTNGVRPSKGAGRPRPAAGTPCAPPAGHLRPGRAPAGNRRPTRRLRQRPGDRRGLLHAGDRRLVAHLPCDDPPGNARLVCELYLSDPVGRHARPLLPADWHCAPGATDAPGAPGGERELVDRRRRAYRLAVRPARWGGGELRWTARRLGADRAETVGLRDVVGALEAYEPACAMTARAIGTPLDPLVSTHALAGELERLRRSRTVLNRPLREAVRRAADDGLSLSQIAARCGRHKSRRTAPRVGDTSWLARRIGLMPEAGREEPSPWIDAALLALIARDGLRIDPRTVEPA